MPASDSPYRGRTVKGMRDLLPPETSVWSSVEEIARRTFQLYSFEEIRTPVVEETELFVRSVGESSEIVGKQMFSFADKRGKSLSLRPENTAPVARAFVQHSLRDRPMPIRLYYIGPQFRYERPQKGRYRQFHQIGAELIGDEGPWSDVEIVLLLMSFLEALGFTGLRALVNTVGDRDSRDVYSAELRRFLEPRASELGDDSRRRLETNTLRILDTKVEAEIELLEGAPRLAEYLNVDSREHFAAFLGGLEECGVEYRVDDRLVRGLDYYTRTVFEIVAAGLGAQNAIVGGGRYDGLIGEVGGDDVPAIGFAIGLDRLIDVLPESFQSAVDSAPAVVVVPAGSVSSLAALQLAQELRREGVAAESELGGRSVKAALRRADRVGAATVVLLGDNELNSGQATIKNFRSGEQILVKRTALAAKLRCPSSEVES